MGLSCKGYAGHLAGSILNRRFGLQNQGGSDGASPSVA